MTLHNRSDQCAIENPSLSSAQATVHATKQQHDPSTYEMTTSTNARAKHAKSKPKRIERWTQDPIEKRWAMNAISRQAENAVQEAKEETSDERRPNRKTSHNAVPTERRAMNAVPIERRAMNAVDTVITLHNTQQSTKSRGSEPQRLHLIVPCQTRKMCSAINPNWEVSYTFNKGR